MSFTYKGLTGQFKRHIVTTQDLDRQLQHILRQNPRISLVDDRPTQDGDEIILDYAGFCNGEQFAGGTAENQTLVLGSGAFIPGFEEQLIGKNVGDKVVVKVTFPEVYHSDALAGKDAEFHCTIHQIRVRSTYELDDTFAQQVGGCQTMEQMRQRLEESMQAFADERSEMDLQDQLVRQAAETLEFQPSEEQIEAEVEKQMQNMAAQLAQQGMNLQMYCQFTGNTEESMRAQARENAMAALAIQATIDQVVALEGLEASQADLDEAMGVVARQNHLTVEQLRNYCDEMFLEALTKSVLTGKVMHLIRMNAQVTETQE